MGALIGKDVTGFAITAQGNDSSTRTWSAGTVENVIGRWKEVSITGNYDWVDRTPSSGDVKEQRQTIFSFKGSLKGQVYAGSLDSFDIGLANTLVYLTFTTADGRSMYCYGGISEFGKTAGKDAIDDSIDFECVGRVNGQYPIGYL